MYVLAVTSELWHSGIGLNGQRTSSIYQSEKLLKSMVKFYKGKDNNNLALYFIDLYLSMANTNLFFTWWYSYNFIPFMPCDHTLFFLYCTTEVAFSILDFLTQSLADSIQKESIWFTCVFPIGTYRECPYFQHCTVAIRPITCAFFCHLLM